MGDQDAKMRKEIKNDLAKHGLNKHGFKTKFGLKLGERTVERRRREEEKREEEEEEEKKKRREVQARSKV